MYIDPSTIDVRSESTVSETDPRCDRCANIGLRIAPNGSVEVCPVITLKQPHAEPSEAARMLHRSVTVMRRRELEIDAFHFEIARTLVAFTTTAPCPNTELVERHFTFTHGTENQRRAVSKAIHQLRDVWLLPVGSRKIGPSGYWIITDQEDFAEWVDRSTRAAITQLSTIHRVAKANWPVFAEQLELRFWSDFEASTVSFSAAAGEGIAPNQIAAM